MVRAAVTTYTLKYRSMSGHADRRRRVDGRCVVATFVEEHLVAMDAFAEEGRHCGKLSLCVPSLRAVLLERSKGRASSWVPRTSPNGPSAATSRVPHWPMASSRAGAGHFTSTPTSQHQYPAPPSPDGYHMGQHAIRHTHHTKAGEYIEWADDNLKTDRLDKRGPAIIAAARR